MRARNGDVSARLHERLELCGDEVARGKNHIAGDEGNVLIGCGVDRGVDAAERASLLVCVGDQANLSKVDQISEKIEVLRLVRGDDELVGEREEAIDAAPNQRFPEKGNGCLAAAHTARLAARLYNYRQISALAHEIRTPATIYSHARYKIQNTTSCEKSEGLEARVRGGQQAYGVIV